jgi:hypothetical protein
MARHLSGNVVIRGKDDESIGRDEFLDDNVRIDKFLNENGQTLSVLNYRRGWGGECRAEAKLEAQVITGGLVSITGEVLLFEGTSENTRDLDGRTNVSFTVPKTTLANPAPTVRSIRVDNTDEGGDYVDFRFTLTNHIIE